MTEKASAHLPPQHARPPQRGGLRSGFGPSLVQHLSGLTSLQQISAGHHARSGPLGLREQTGVGLSLRYPT